MNNHRHLTIGFIGCIALFAILIVAVACTAPTNTPVSIPAPTQLFTVDYENGAVIMIEAETGLVLPHWEIPAQGWVNQLSLIDKLTLALSYMPEPNQDGAVKAYDRAGIYTLSLVDSQLTPILVPDEPNTYFYNPMFTNDGQYLFYIRYVMDATGSAPPDVMLMRHNLTDGTEREMMQDAIWPRLSADTSHITAIIVDPETQNRGLIVMDIDGNNIVELVRVGEYYDIDTPLFSADGTHITFTASLAGRKVTWLDKLFGVQVALAHADRNVPVEWMRVSVSGGKHTQLSAEKRAILYGTLDSTGETLYFSTLDGLFAMPSGGGAFTAVHPSQTLRTVTVR